MGGRGAVAEWRLSELPRGALLDSVTRPIRVDGGRSAQAVRAAAAAMCERVDTRAVARRLWLTSTICG